MLTPPGAAPTPYSNIGDVSDNYKQISTKFLAICLLTRVMSITCKGVEISYPLLGQPHPPILKHLIFLANRQTEKAKDENRNH